MFVHQVRVSNHGTPRSQLETTGEDFPLALLDSVDFQEAQRSGAVSPLHASLPRLLQAAQARLEQCECEAGCLSCVHMAGCGEYNEGLEKDAAAAILRWLLQGERPDAPAPTVAAPEIACHACASAEAEDDDEWE